MTPIEIMFSKAKMRCAVCDTLSTDGCLCWEKCSCGWSAMRGFQCNNPDTTRCSTKIKYKRQSTKEEYWKACEVGQKARRKRKRAERAAAKQNPIDTTTRKA